MLPPADSYPLLTLTPLLTPQVVEEFITLPLIPSHQASPSTHLTQGEKAVIGGTCMFVVNIFLNPFWIGFKRLSEESLLSPDSICREGFVNG